MIEKIEDEKSFENWKKRDVFTVRILALLNSYSTGYHFCSFYRQIIDGRVTAVLSRLDSNYTLSVDSGFDNEELVHFFCVSGYSNILSGDEFEISPRFDEGEVMLSFDKNDGIINGAQLNVNPKLNELFNFIDYESQDFKSWYVDISHRIRHRTAKAYSLTRGGMIISSGILSSIIDGYSILTAVKTKEDYRRLGYGSALVNAICRDADGGVYIMREENENEEFYKNLGFESSGKWRMYR